MNYLEKLRESSKKTGSIVCMGLDPVIEAMPEKYASEGIEGVHEFLCKIFDEMIMQDVLAGAFKLNQGFYLKHDKPRSRRFQGSRALVDVLDTLEDVFPETPVILDFKRGDIAKSSANYATEGFDKWKADAVTVAPYMGTDSVSPFTAYCNDEQGKGVYILNRTSNKGAKDLQNLNIFPSAGKPLYEVVGEKILEWSKENPGVGAVVGATSLGELAILSKLYAGKDISTLIPGVGGQGGKADEVAAILREADYELALARINSSSGLTHPWAKDKELKEKLEKGYWKDYPKVCVAELNTLNEQIAYKP